jgi:hypothetical protein
MLLFHRYNALAALALLALGVFIVQQSVQWEFLGRNGPGVGFFPLVYGTLIVVLALVLAAKSLLAARRASATSSPDVSKKPAGAGRSKGISVA